MEIKEKRVKYTLQHITDDYGSIIRKEGYIALNEENDTYDGIIR